MRIQITGSKVHRVWKCPASAILPQVVGDDSKSAPARGRGKEIHRYLERVKVIGEQALDEMDGPVRDLCAALDLDDLPVGLATEVAFAWNWREQTGRILAGVVDRRYELAQPSIDWGSETPCTVDVVGIQRMVDPPDHVEGAPTRGYVGDYKSGHGKYPAPDQFGQLLLGALCVRAVYGCDDVVLELIHIHDDGTNHKSRRTVNDWDLDAFAEDWRWAMDLVGHWEVEYARGRAVAAREGPWCPFCDAYKSCPAKVALVKSIPDELLAMGIRLDQESGSLILAPGNLVAAQPQRLADAWMMTERIDDVLSRVRAEICSLAAYQEVPLPDGRVIGMLRTERRDLDGRIAHQVLEKRYGRETADAAVEISSSFAALHQAVQKHIQKGEKFKTKVKDGQEDRLIAEIDRLGGIGLNTTEGVKPHVPKKKRLPGG